MSTNKKLLLFLISVVILSLYLIIPLLEFNCGNKMYVFSYKDDATIYDDYHCYDESVAYNKQKDISITGWDVKKVPFGFYMITLEYEEGNKCDTEFVLEEKYIEHFLKNAKISEDSDDVDLEELIKGKEAVIKNKRYPWNEDHKWIGYELDGKHQDMFIYTDEDGLLIIQVGLSDEGPKYIAYKEVYEMPKDVDYSEYDFVGKTWVRTTDSDTEYLNFNKDGSFSYYCGCGSEVDNSDLCEYYTYDGKDTIYVHCDFDKYTKKEIKIISLKKKSLKIDFDGDIREFKLKEEK